MAWSLALFVLFFLSVSCLVPVVHALSATIGPSSRSQSTSSIGWEHVQGRRILVVGGSGRVGGSVTTQLISHGAHVTVGGTQYATFVTARNRWQRQFPEYAEALARVPFVVVDREQAETVKRVLQPSQTNDTLSTVVAAAAAAAAAPFDLVVHTAGPFQGKAGTPNGVLQASIAASVPYLDVCDDYETAVAARNAYTAMAQDCNVPCIVSTGCWPGVSSLMAQRLVTQALARHSHLDAARDLELRFSFFTAGSGGAGVTLLVATFLILAEPAWTMVRGRRQPVPAMAEYNSVSFGPTVGCRDVAPLNLLETASLHETLGVGSVSSWFGTAPNVWNTLLGYMAKLPSTLLANEDIMRRLSIFSMPIVRAVDYFAGATNAMRCDLTYHGTASTPSWTTTAFYGHDNLEPCVGECVAAFCAALLTPNCVPAGVWFPEQAVSGNDTLAVLELASGAAHTKVW